MLLIQRSPYDAVFLQMTNTLKLMHQRHTATWTNAPYITNPKNDFSKLLTILRNFAGAKNIPDLAPFYNALNKASASEISNVQVTINSHIRSIVEQAFIIRHYELSNKYAKALLAEKDNISQQLTKLKELANLCGLRHITPMGQPAHASKHLVGAAVDFSVTAFTYKQKNKETTVSGSNEVKKFRDTFVNTVVKVFRQLQTVTGEPWHVEIKNQALKAAHPIAYDALFTKNNYTPENFNTRVLTLLLDYYTTLYGQPETTNQIKQRKWSVLNSIYAGLTSLADSIWYKISTNGRQTDPAVANALAQIARAIESLKPDAPTGAQNIEQKPTVVFEGLLKGEEEILFSPRLTQEPVSTILPVSPPASTIDFKITLPSVSEGMQGAYELNYDPSLADIYPTVEALWIPTLSTTIPLSQLSTTVYYEPFSTKLARFLADINSYFKNFARLPLNVVFTYPELVAIVRLRLSSLDPFNFSSQQSQRIVGMLPPEVQDSTILTLNHTLPSEKFKVKLNKRDVELQLRGYSQVTLQNLRTYVNELNNIIKQAVREPQLSKDNLYNNYLLLRTKDLAMLITDIQATYVKHLVIESITKTLEVLGNPQKLSTTEQILAFVGHLVCTIANVNVPQQATQKGPAFFREQFNLPRNRQTPVSNTLKLLDNIYSKCDAQMASLAATAATSYATYKTDYINEQAKLSADTTSRWESWAKSLNEAFSTNKDIASVLPPELRVKFLAHKATVTWQAVVWSKISTKGLLYQFLRYLKGDDVQIIEPITTADKTDTTIEYKKLMDEFNKLKREIDAKLLGQSIEKQNKLVKDIEEISSKAAKGKFSQSDASALPPDWHIF